MEILGIAGAALFFVCNPTRCLTSETAPSKSLLKKVMVFPYDLTVVVEVMASSSVNN